MAGCVTPNHSLCFAGILKFGFERFAVLAPESRRSPLVAKSPIPGVAPPPAPPGQKRLITLPKRLPSSGRSRPAI
jgi:hypothetical protein